MNKSHWDLARDAKTMAVTTTVTIDPKLITVRIRNKITKWLEQGYLEGGYASEARKLADMLVKKYNLEAVGISWRGIGVTNPSPELVERLVPILDADWAAFVLENPEQSIGWYKNQKVSARTALINREPKVYLSIHDKNLRIQAGKLIAELSDNNRKQLVKLALDAINGTEPIHVYTHQY
jgi:hypothetical protein